MDNQKIENIAVTALNREVNKYSRLVADIKTNDKTVSLDGQIFVYRKEKLTKENLYGIVPVQIKGKLSEDLIKDVIPYSLDVKDLINYNNIQGAFLFVVLINSQNTDIQQIYYRQLLPVDLKLLLQNISLSQKTKTIYCKKLTQDLPNLEDLCFDFVMNKYKQEGQISGFMMDFETAKEKGLPIYFLVKSKPQDLFQNLFNKEHYIYTSLSFYEDKVLEIPLNVKGTISTVERKVNIYVDEKLIATKIPFIIYKDGRKEIKLPNNIIICLVGANMRITYQEKGSIKERIESIKVMISICGASNLKIDRNTITYAAIPNTERIEMLQRRLAFLEDLYQILKFWGVNQEIDLESFSPDCYTNINALAVALSDPKHYISIPKFTLKTTCIRMIKIANLYLIVLFKHIKDDIFALENFFNLPDREFYISVGTEKILISRYVIMKSQQYVCASNISWNDVKKDMCSIPFSTIYGEYLTSSLIAMLNAYDSTGNKQLFSLIKAVNNYLTKNDPDNIPNIINHAQILYREKKFYRSDKEILLKIQQRSETNITAKLCIAVLLKQPNTKDLYNRLTQEEREDFNSWPISNLWEKGK